jgi:hypothetical protein
MEGKRGNEDRAAGPEPFDYVASAASPYTVEARDLDDRAVRG